MSERMLDKNEMPTLESIQVYMGASYPVLLRLEELMKERYELNKEMKFPFGNNYGWGYKYNHKQVHLCYVFFEKGTFTVMLQLGDRFVNQIEASFEQLSSKARLLWQNRYPCGEQGGWIHYMVEGEEDLNDILIFLNIKKKFIKH